MPVKFRRILPAVYMRRTLSTIARCAPAFIGLVLPVRVV